ncbi:MAG: hypothetical protein PUB32_08760 [Clostridiales bacterium]|nr:hypothetical protein [Clostridiales bacterium]
MKKITAFILSVLFLISLSACNFLFREEPLPDENTQPPSTAPTDTISPSVEPSGEPDSNPSASPDINTPSPSDSPAPSVPPEETKELTVYVNGSSVTVTAVPYTGKLRDKELSFKMYYDAETYDAVFKNNAYLFRPISENVDPVTYMEVSFINGTDAEVLLPSFADSYIDFTDIEFSSYTLIGEEHLNAESIIAYNGEQYLNAYLIDVPGGVVTIVISSTSQYSEFFAWFNAMLGTFTIE